ncbi:MAG: 50S ribosomal protein L31e [Sulfolobales archaeon]
MSEGIYVINLGKLYRTGRYRRLARAIKAIKEFIRRHTKANEVIIDRSINEYIFSRAYDKPPSKIAVKITKVDEGVVKASLALEVSGAS